VLEIKNIVKTYKTADFVQNALDGVSLSFPDKGLISILGQSGSGKTSLLNVISGLDNDFSGELVINGKPTKQFKDKDWDAYRNNSVGFIFQSYNLISHISVLDNVEMSMTLSGISKKIRREKALAALEKVGLKDHVKKKPTQLSGGQAQRVAIARALVNEPDLILADEPSGALDSRTSLEVMELIRDISKEKLVVMVTHNDELANTYSDRIIKLADGKVIDDSHPFVIPADTPINYNPKKTAMNFITALSLSGNNIKTKLGRTILTVMASSIGILGISLILSLSVGFQQQIDDFEETTLGNFPVSLNQVAWDLASIDRDSQSSRRDEYENFDSIQPFDMMTLDIAHQNILSKEVLEHIRQLNENVANADGSPILAGISFTRATNFNLLRDDTPLQSQTLNLQALPESQDLERYLNNNFELLAGHFPTDKTELILSVGAGGFVNAELLGSLGFPTDEEISFEDVVGTELTLLHNNDFYIPFEMPSLPQSETAQLPEGMTLPEGMDLSEAGELPEGFEIPEGMEIPDEVSSFGGSFIPSPNADAKGLTLTIVGVMRETEDSGTGAGALTGDMSSAMGSMVQLGNIFYTNDLINYVIAENQDSDIVVAQRASDVNVLTGEVFSTEEAATVFLGWLGDDTAPLAVNIFPSNFDSKEVVINHLQEWNDAHVDQPEAQLVWTDLAALISGLSSGIMSGITDVLIAFSSVSLVVSGIMVGVLTLVSTLERKKEIGILRALGARKKDVTRIFSAENFIIGISSGLFGVIVAYLLTFPINDVLYSRTDLENVANLPFIYAVIMVLISIAVTAIGGFIPSKLAAKNDPAETLRSE